MNVVSAFEVSGKSGVLSERPECTGRPAFRQHREGPVGAGRRPFGPGIVTPNPAIARTAFGRRPFLRQPTLPSARL